MDGKPGRALQARGFTLVELLVVVLIITLVSAVALPTVYSALGNRQVSEAGRILQGALVGARDKAIHDNQPAGFRMLPDPAWPLQYGTDGRVVPWQTLAYSRVIPIEAPPQYTDGLVNVFPAGTYSAAVRTVNGYAGCPCLVLEECVKNPATGAPNPPTSWFWNIRVGDKLQLNNSGTWYNVVGPLGLGPADGNTEMFVNIGVPGTALPALNGPVPCEFLLLTNGRDDDGNGWMDEGFDGVDNNGNTAIDEDTSQASEWEVERWSGAAGKGLSAAIYTIRRRPAPAANAREITLPPSMVIDATTTFLTSERSRLPVNPFTGAVDVLLAPDGTLAPSTIYASPASLGMTAHYLHFWLADRRDVVDVAAQPDSSGNVAPVPIETVGGVSHYLPIQRSSDAGYSFPTLKGSYMLLTLAGRSGGLVVTDSPPFDDPVAAATAGRPYDISRPFEAVQRGGH